MESPPIPPEPVPEPAPAKVRSARHRRFARIGRWTILLALVSVVLYPFLEAWHEYRIRKQMDEIVRQSELQLFQNLISNAIKYRKPTVPPWIGISGVVQGQQVLFKVADNGVGFDPIYAEKVFKLFTRLNESQYAGTGLGLAICQRMVEQYGGRIWADSWPDEGSTFFFTLPAAQSTRQGVNAASSNQ